MVKLKMQRKKSNNNGLENLNFDDPSPEETEKHQKRAEEIQYCYTEVYHRANDLLKSKEYIKTLPQKIEWLKRAGYRGVDVLNQTEVPFAKAIELGYSKNIYAMFKNEVKVQKKRKKEAEKYLFILKKAC